MLILKRYKSGEYGCRPWWYIRYNDGCGGERLESPLPVKVGGVPPPNLQLTLKGDAAFEASRALAQVEHDKFMDELRRKGTCEHLKEDLIASKTGEQVRYVRLSDLVAKWADYIKDSEMTDERRRNNLYAVKCFVDYADEHFTDARGRKLAHLHLVRDEDAQSYFDYLSDTLAWATVKERVYLLRRVFNTYLPVGWKNAFNKINVRRKSRNRQRIHHAPLTEEQAAKVIDTARRIDMDNAESIAAGVEIALYPLALCCLGTGMRIGDVCTLKWSEVLPGRIDRIQNKTGIRIEAPILSADLERELDVMLTAREPGEAYVFPRANMMLRSNETGVIRRGKNLFAEALFGHLRLASETVEVENDKPSAKKTLAEILDAIAASNHTEKMRTKMREVYVRYAQGASYRVIAEELGLSKGQVNGYLTEIGKAVGACVIRNKKFTMTKRELLKMTRQKREVGKHSGSIYGWHSFRSTWCTIADARGVPHATIAAVVGHTTFRTTMEYIHPTWQMYGEQLRSNLRGSILLGDSATQPKPSANDVIDVGETMTVTVAQPFAPAPALPLAALVTGLSPESQEKIRFLTADEKAELRSLPSVSAAEAYLQLH